MTEIPIWNWDKIKHTLDLRYLIRHEDFSQLIDEAEVDQELLSELYFNMQDEVHKIQDSQTYGGHYLDQHIELLELKKQKLIMSCDDYNANLSMIKTKIAQLENEINANSEHKSEQTLEDQAVILIVFFKFEIDTKKMSAYKWYKLMQSYDRQTEELNRQRSRSKA